MGDNGVTLLELHLALKWLPFKLVIPVIECLMSPEGTNVAVPSALSYSFALKDACFDSPLETVCAASTTNRVNPGKELF